MDLAMISLLLTLLCQTQHVDIQNSPNHEYVLQATVPVANSFNGSLVVEGYPTDSRVIANAQEWKIYEVCALVPPNSSSFNVVPGTPTSIPRVGYLHLYAAMQNFVVLRMTDDAGSQDFSLTGPFNDGFLTRKGNIYRQIHRHMSLGRFGKAHVWIGMKGGTTQLDFSLLIHNGVPGPDIKFRSAQIITPNGVSWANSLGESVSQPPYLIKEGRHTLPQQYCRPFWFSVFPNGSVPKPDYIGVADWSQGGFLPSAFPVPEIQFSYAGLLTDRRWRLNTLQPTQEEPGEIPPSALWPSAGVRQPDMGGGIGKYPLDGVRLASTGDPSGFDYFKIGFLRDAVRSQRRFEPDGHPLRLNGGTWQYYDGFLNGRDDPWGWHNWPMLWGGSQDPRNFNQYGISTLVRSNNESLVLAWLTNEPIAKLFVLETATRARMTFWEGPGIANRLRVPLDEKMGSEIGMAEANAGLAIAAAICFGATEYETWRNVFLEHLRRVQMDSGCFSAHNEFNYPGDRAPFYNQYKLQGGSELAMLGLAAYSLGEREMMDGIGRAMFSIATDDDDPGFYYFFPTGQGDIRFVTEDDWPIDLREQMGIVDASYYTAWDMGYAVAILKDTKWFHPLAWRFTWSWNPLQTMEDWGLVAPNWQTGAPIEQWWPLKGIYSVF